MELDFACSAERELAIFDQANLSWSVIDETHKVILPVYDLRQNNISCGGSPLMRFLELEEQEEGDSSVAA